MPRLSSRFALFLLGAVALLGAATAQATDLPPAGTAPAVAAATQPPPKKDQEYQLWSYSRKDGWVKAKGENPHKSHKALHTKGKNANRTHVHPMYWNEDIKAAAGARNEMLFTVTKVGAEPARDVTPKLPKFCVHYCNNRWMLQTDGSTRSYQDLYDEEVALGHECRDPSEDCSSPAGDPQYFTICAMGQVLGDGTVCCAARAVPTVLYACPPVVICTPPARQRHCLLGGLLRSRRGSAPCCGR